jgi:hypothetical protein
MLEQLDTPEMREISEVLETQDLQRIHFEREIHDIFEVACKIIRENGLQDKFYEAVTAKRSGTT